MFLTFKKLPGLTYELLDSPPRVVSRLTHNRWTHFFHAFRFISWSASVLPVAPQPDSDRSTFWWSSARCRSSRGSCTNLLPGSDVHYRDISPPPNRLQWIWRKEMLGSNTVADDSYHLKEPNRVKRPPVRACTWGSWVRLQALDPQPLATPAPPAKPHMASKVRLTAAGAIRIKDQGYIV